MAIVITLLILSILLNIFFFIKLRNLARENKKEIITVMKTGDDSSNGIKMWGEFDNIDKN